MAFGNSGDEQGLWVTGLALDVPLTVTLCGVRIAADTASGSQGITGVSNAAATAYITLYRNVGPNRYWYLQQEGNGGNYMFSTDTMANTTWYRAALRVQSTDGSLYWSSSDAALTKRTNSATWTNGAQFDRFNLLYETGNVYAELNGGAFGVKLYSAALTDAEIERETKQIRPWRTANLVGWWPLTHDWRDYSGNGRHLVKNGTAADPFYQDSGPIPYGDSPPVVGPYLSPTARARVQLRYRLQ